MDHQSILEMLNHSAGDLKRVMESIPTDWLHWHEEHEWSPHETLGHVVESERQVDLVRIRRIAEEDRPVLKYFDEVAWHQTHYDPQQSIDMLLKDYLDARREEIEILRAQADWARWGLHATVQKRYSLDFQARHALNHTWEHLNQIETTLLHCELAKQSPTLNAQ
jgi:hypothetical protein